MPVSANGPAPYTTAGAAITAISAFRDRGMGSPITADTLMRAGVSESIANRTLSSLRALELINEAGEPTQQFTDLRLARGDEEYQARLQEWLRSVYADVLQYTDPSKDSSDRVAEAFRTYEPAGQRRAMAALLIGLWKLAGMPVPDGSNATARTPTRPSGRTRVPPKLKPLSRTPAPPNPSLDDLHPGLVGLLRQIPRDGRSWTSDRRDEFVRAFGAVLDFSVPINEQQEEIAEDDMPEGGEPMRRNEGTR